MNGRIIVAKPLYVALAQRKEDRKAHLASQYIQRMAGMRMQGMQQMPGVQQMGMGGYLMPAAGITPQHQSAQQTWDRQTWKACHREVVPASWVQGWLNNGKGWDFAVQQWE